MKDYLNSSQMEASDPRASVWAMASAGTGKTTVLIARLIKLLLSGARPSKIVCLTFTNTAAAEIRARINREIARWSKESDEELTRRIRAFFGSATKTKMLQRARDLIEITSSSADTVKICTIHSFCQHILSRFPIEAGVPPAFRVIDEMLAEQVVQQLKEKILLGDGCRDAVKYFAQNFHESRLDQILASATSGRFAGILSSFESRSAYREHLASLMSIDLGSTVQELIEKQIGAFAGMPGGSFALLSDKDLAVLSELKKYLSLDPQEKLRRWSDLGEIFLDSNGLARKRVLSDSALSLYPELVAFMAALQKSFIEALEKVRRLSTLEASVQLFDIARELMMLYSSYKRSRGCLDYADLISFTANLLNKSSEKDWVLYKLDGGIEHILIDEAQDTSLEQWKVVGALIADFFAHSEYTTGRSIFVVGDAKQSIYSFQGASVEGLHEMQGYMRLNIGRSGGLYKEVNLSDCYRSGQTIVDFVKRALEASSATFAIPNLRSAVNNNQARVEVWPPFLTRNAKEQRFWPIPSQAEQPESGKHNFALLIAKHISSLLEKGIVLPSTGKPIEEKDITILVQRRNEFTKILADALKSEGLRVSGLDRLQLRENLVILDIIAIAKFSLLPSDDLNCAIVLKSPIFSFSEEEIFKLSLQKGIWNKLKASDSKACLILNSFLHLHESCSIFDYFYAIVEVMGCKSALLKEEFQYDEDVIDAFLQVVKQFETQVADDLYKFVDWFLNSEVEVKRDFSDDGFIKIMTVHACKGMESGVVIIPDSLNLDFKEHLLCVLDEAVFLIRHESEFTRECKKLRQKLDYQEYLRLMYVAFTRCKDYLIICGHSFSKTVSPLSWHSIAQRAIKGSIEQMHGMEILVSQKEPFKLSPSKRVQEPNRPKATFLVPLKRQDYEEKTGLSPFMQRQGTYGSVIHKLLEEVSQGAPIEQVLNHPLLVGNRLIALKLKDLVNSKLWSSLFVCAQEILTEVSINDCDSGLIRLDLLIVSEQFVDVIDYKSDSKPALSYDQVPLGYKSQLQKYKTALQKIYSTKAVRGWILWIQNCSLMEITN